ncbi:MAG: sulfurtransferase-like selenium metabolism protein YedF [Syntrophomonadaceae bacterium]|nr:sulfurtransferase-like selenium metabolism protein YedF [Syntrophomonadaceae bacterium]
MNKIVDARGLSCPQPVVLTKKAMDEGGYDSLITIVDRTAALENVSKLAEKQGYQVAVEEKGGEFHISMSRDESLMDVDISMHREVAVLITSRWFGQGEEELGKVLMKSFLYTLSEMTGQLSHIVFMNSAVFLTTEGSEVKEILTAIAEDGVEILSCGTCLDFYNLKDKLAVGEITNMFTAMDIIAGASRNITI